MRAWNIQALIFCALFFVSSCSTPEQRLEKAQTLAAENQFKTLVLQTSTFPIYTSQKISEHTEEITIVIEGDGLAWIDYNTPSDDPSPENPVGLKIALKLGENIIYLARPCQYVQPACKDYKYWTSHRFSPEVIKAYMDILDQLYRDNPVRQYRLIGYSGGAYIALLLAEKRSDIKTVTTISGLLDPDEWSSFHEISYLHSIKEIRSNPNIKYFHFCGEDDAIVPCYLTKKFIDTQREKGSLNHKVVEIKNVNHENLWQHVPIAYGLEQFQE